MARRRSAVRIGVTGLGEREELAPGIFINTHYRGCTPGFIHTEEGIVLVAGAMLTAVSQGEGGLRLDLVRVRFEPGEQRGQ